ncbi:prisilkin-39-like [Rhipicephalus sanguineus]|uniref:prisilkin-39-like n=1 Tax=Rhipicephalus sanguineus TaxID=34632 RepID=UPI001892F0FB|nr:prisilkin-39-like [Rhipicephalus sanguineus]
MFSLIGHLSLETIRAVTHVRKLPAALLSLKSSLDVTTVPDGSTVAASGTDSCCQIRACIILALATCAFGVYSGYPYGYSGAVPAAYGGYQAPLASLSSYGYGLGHVAPSYGYGLGSYGIRACLLLALATCLGSGYPVGYPVAAPAYAAYQAPLASVLAVHHTPGFGYGLGYGLPAYGYGLGSYGLSY